MTKTSESNPPIRHILITGASSGIGHALSLAYAEAHCILYLAGRDKARLDIIADKCRIFEATVHIKQIDVTNQKAMATWIKGLNQLDLVIANAGIAIGDISPIDQDYETSARQIFDVNLGGVLNTLHPAIDVMRDQGFGQIAMVSSLAGYRGLPTAPAYSASKTAVKAYGEALIPNLKAHNIHLSVICPGFVKSGITDKNKFPMPFFMQADTAAARIKEGLEKRIPLIAFPWPLRFITWIFAILPSRLAIRILSLSGERKG